MTSLTQGIAWGVAALVTYLVGSVPFGLLIGKVFYGVDIREHGSGNVGATNLVRVVGRTPGIACFALDFAKGLVPTFAAIHMAQPTWLAVVLGALAILGHSRSIFLGFKGGKSVATGVGVIVALAPPVGLAALGTWLVVFWPTRIVSLASIVAAASVPVWMLVFHAPWAYVGVGTAAALYVIVRHRANIRRLMNGTESRMGTMP